MLVVAFVRFELSYMATPKLTVDDTRMMRIVHKYFMAFSFLFYDCVAVTVRKG